mgnify:CR=1 FL=1
MKKLNFQNNIKTAKLLPPLSQKEVIIKNQFTGNYWFDNFIESKNRLVRKTESENEYLTCDSVIKVKNIIYKNNYHIIFLCHFRID